MPTQTPEEAAVFVKRWMDDRKLFNKDSSNDTVYFSYDGTCTTGVNISIQQPKDVVRTVGVTAKMLIPPHALKILSDLDQAKRGEFFRILSRNLMFVSPSFAIGPTMEKPEWLFFIKEISYDELTEGRLIENVDLVNRAVLWAASIFFEQFGFGEPEKE
jgi:hypothetical protein